MELKDLREKLTSLDKELIRIISERQSIVHQIGEYKLQVGRATRDFERESAVINYVRQEAIETGIEPDIAEEIITVLIRSSLTKQEKDLVEAAGKGKTGGCGGRLWRAPPIPEPQAPLAAAARAILHEL